MAEKIWNIIGLMSGSSLDGVDIANCRFVVQEEPDFKILNWEITAAETFPYSADILDKLKEATNLKALELCAFDRYLGNVYGEMINSFCLTRNVKPDLIASHGHTIFHYPENGFTLQIGHPSNIAAKTGFDVIADFRSMDVALGGQGAPFAPIVDFYLFGQYQVLINLGGIVNISFIGSNKEIRAYDICPGNQVLDYLAHEMGLAFDKSGKLAQNGTVDFHLLETLMEWPYFKKSGPKSIDNLELKKFFEPLFDRNPGTVEDKLNTMVVLISSLIKKSLMQNGLTENQNILITGGGAHNTFLVSKISQELADENIVLPEELIVDFKEALLMSLMGLLRIYNKTNVLSSVTGSRMDHCAGAFYPGIFKN